MRWALGVALVVACAGCDRRDAPADRIVESAEKIAEPAETEPLAQGRYAPRDECGEVAGAAAFRSQLAAAVRQRDAEALTALAAEDIKLDFGGSSGADELRRRLLDPDRMLWQELEALLALGCSANDQGGITIPWIADQDLTIADPGMAMLVSAEDVAVREAPDGEAPSIGTVSWDIVEVEMFQPGAPFQQVTLPDETSGFIETGKLRSMLDYRLTASSRNGKWSMTSFLAGD